MKSLSLTAILFSVLALLPASVQADSPATQPAAAPPPPYVLIVPPGMQEVTVAGHTVICAPDYVETAKKAIAKVIPATRPTTMPSDLLARLAEARPKLLQEIPADLGISQDKVADFLDNKLKPSVTKLADIQIKCYIILAPQTAITAALKSGWHAPLFHYNQLSDQAEYQSQVSVSVERKPDDVVLWSEVKPGESDADIADGVTNTIREFDLQFARRMSLDAMLQTQNSFITFIADNVIKPLKLPTTEEWLGMGIIENMTAKYLAPISGYDRDVLTNVAATDSPSNPIKSAPLDLMHAFDTSDVKPQFMIYYQDAISRKGTSIVQTLLAKAGDTCVLKIINAIKSAAPADNVGLVRLIKELTSVDLTSYLLPPP